LIGHYVNYRKQVRATTESLLPESEFRLYGISTRFPDKLVKQVRMVAQRGGEYQVIWGTHDVRVLVLSEMPVGRRTPCGSCSAPYRKRSPLGRGIIGATQATRARFMNRLFEFYRLEEIAMPYTVEDFRRDATRESSGVPAGRGADPRPLAGGDTEGRSQDEIRAYLDQLERQGHGKERH